MDQFGYVYLKNGSNEKIEDKKGSNGSNVTEGALLKYTKPFYLKERLL